MSTNDTPLPPLLCPKCENTSHDRGPRGGITRCYLVWRVMRVTGAEGEEVVVDYNDSDHVDISNSVVTTMTNVPNETPDLEHLMCHRCHWCWHDPRPTVG